MRISTEDQKILKGIAIIGMMMLHFWAFPNWVLPEHRYNGILPNNMYSALGAFGNVCVSIFAFITGYSFYTLADRWDKRSYRKQKILGFLFEYWVYVAIYVIIGFLMKETMPSPLQFFVNLFGLEVSIGAEGICIPFAWYVSYYLSAISLYPLIRKLWNGNLVKDICFIAITYFLIKSIAYFTQGYYCIGFYFARAGVLVITLIAFCIAKYNTFQKIEEKKQKNKALFLLVNFVLIIVLVVLKIFYNDFLVDWWGGIYTFYITYFVLHGLFNKLIFLGKILEKLGKYSMGMWLISGLFFMNGRLQALAFFPKKPILILLWVIFITFVISYIVTNLCMIIKKRAIKVFDGLSH